MTSDTFNILFIVFLIMGIVLALLTVILFFVFDIRKIISIKTGHAMRQSIRELEEINRSNDNKNRRKYKAHSIELYKDYSKDIVATSDVMATTGNLEDEPTDLLDNEPINTEASDENRTTVLQNPDEGETTVLGMAENTDIENPSLEVTASLERTMVKSVENNSITEPKQLTGKFEITETKMVVFEKEIKGGG
ncbi:MAG: hypothetical protein K2I10_05865 [Lachnospiraceae bacterium]|nr:hypothetical protein [Lachnospiraceae bacterium]